MPRMHGQDPEEAAKVMGTFSLHLFFFKSGIILQHILGGGSCLVSVQSIFYRLYKFFTKRDPCLLF